MSMCLCENVDDVDAEYVYILDEMKVIKKAMIAAFKKK